MASSGITVELVKHLQLILSHFTAASSMFPNAVIRDTTLVPCIVERKTSSME